MTRTKGLFVALGIAGLFAGCATGYHSTGLTGGFSDTQLAPDEFRIIFRGNAFATPERVQDFALLRASELSTQNGFACFAIVNENNWNSVHTWTTPGRTDTTTVGGGTAMGNIYFQPSSASYFGTSSTFGHSTTTYTPPQTYTMYKPRTGLLIKCFPTKPDGIYVFDAAFLGQSLKTKYGVK